MWPKLLDCDEFIINNYYFHFADDRSFSFSLSLSGAFSMWEDFIDSSSERNNRNQLVVSLTSRPRRRGEAENWNSSCLFRISGLTRSASSNSFECVCA